MADELWPFLVLLALLVLTGTLGTVMGAFGGVVDLLCPDPSSPFSVWWC